MRVRKKRSVHGRQPERRHRRSSLLVEALRFQLDACREDEGLDAIVVSDEMGFCVAHSGGGGDHDDLASQLPLIADPVQRLRDATSEDPLLTLAPSVTGTTFKVSGATLHLGTVRRLGSDRQPGAGTINPALLDRVASGFSRLLGA